MTLFYTKTNSGLLKLSVAGLVPLILKRVIALLKNKLEKDLADTLYLGKTAKALSAKVADSANSVLGSNVNGAVSKATHASSADSADSVPWSGVLGAPLFPSLDTVVPKTGSRGSLAGYLTATYIKGEDYVLLTTIDVNISSPDYVVVATYESDIAPLAGNKMPYTYTINVTAPTDSSSFTKVFVLPATDWAAMGVSITINPIGGLTVHSTGDLHIVVHLLLLFL